MMFSVNHFFINADKACDMVPVLSAATGVVNLIQKIALLIIPNTWIARSDYYSYLNDKSFVRCFASILVPIFYNLFSAADHKLNKWECPYFVLLKTHRNPQNFLLSESPARHDPRCISLALDRGVTVDQLQNGLIRIDNPEQMRVGLRNNEAGFTRIFTNYPQVLTGATLADPEIVRKFLTVRPDQFQRISEGLRNDREFVLSLINAGIPIQGIEFLGDDLKRDDIQNHDIIVDMVLRRPDDFRTLTQGLRGNINLVRRILDRGGSPSIEFMSYLRGNRELMRQCLSRRPEDFEFVSDVLRSDRDFVLSLINAGIPIVGIHALGPNLRSDREIVWPMLLSRPDDFQYLPTEMQKNRELVISLIRANQAPPLPWLTEEMQNDPDVIISILRQRPQDFASVPVQFRNDVVFIRRLHEAQIPIVGIHLLGERLRSDPTVFWPMLQRRPEDVVFLPFEIRTDRALIKAIVQEMGERLSPNQLINLPQEMREHPHFAQFVIDLSLVYSEINRDAWIQMLIEEGIGFDKLTSEQQRDSDLIVAILKAHPRWVRTCFDAFSSDYKFFSTILKKYPKIILEEMIMHLVAVDKKLVDGLIAFIRWCKAKTPNREMTKILVAHMEFHEEIQSQIRNDPELLNDWQYWLKQIKDHHSALQYIPDFIRSDPEFIQVAIETNPRCKPYLIQVSSVAASSVRD